MTNKNHLLIMCTLTFLSPVLLTHVAFAQSDTLVTDRPDVAESSKVVGKHFQVEAGGDATLRSSTSDTQVVFPLKLRQGITHTFEIHLETDTYTISPSGENSLTSPEIGTKWHLGHDAEGTWSLGILTALSLPLFDTSLWTFSPTLALDLALTPRLSLGNNLGVSVTFAPRGEGTQEARFASSLGISLTDNIGMYTEIFGQWQFSNHLILSADAGMTYTLSPNLQLDGYVRQGFYHDNDTGVGLGISFRI